MERFRIVPILLLLLVSTVSATSVNANFKNWKPYLCNPAGDCHISTNMQLNSGFTLSLVSGEVGSTTNPSNIVNGDVVCKGATLKVTPTLDTKWAVSSFDALSLYPSCSPAYCPQMQSAGGVSTNQNIHWVSSAIFSEHTAFGATASYVFNWNDPFAQDKYNDVGGDFHVQPVSYIVDSSYVYGGAGTYSGKKGGANVFCKGQFKIEDGATSLSTTNLPTLNSPTFQVSTTGSHTIKTSIKNAECFAELLKYPTDMSSHQDFFRIYFFTENRPSISSTSATKTISIDVQDSGGTCNMNEVWVAPTGTFAGDSDLVRLDVGMKNLGADPIKVTSVSGTNPQYNYYELSKGLCTLLGISSSFCPVSSGFDEQINGGAVKTLHVLVQKKTSGSSGGTTLIFYAETISTSCGGAGTCSDTVPINIIDCAIDPGSLSYGKHEVAEFLVTCYDLGGDPIPCIGSNWYWLGMSGGFIEKDSTHALAYPTSSTGATGTLNYQSGAAHCWSDITVTSAGNDPDEDYECELIPSSVTMTTGEQKYFELNCFKSGSPSTPDDADYYIIGGLLGTKSNSSVDGTTFTAGNPSAGDLMSYAFWNIPGDDPVLGAVAFADITVGSNGGNTTNQTGGGGDDENDGTSEWCQIGTGPLNDVYPGYTSWVPIICKGGQCHNVSWSDLGAVSVYDGDDDGTMFTAIGNPGDYGVINACVDVDQFSDHCCWRGFYIQEPECWEFS